MLHYEYWTHYLGEKYLIRLDDSNAITGICGPLQQAEIPEANRHNFDYDQQPLLTAWLKLHTSEFQHGVSARQA